MTQEDRDYLIRYLERCFSKKHTIFTSEFSINLSSLEDAIEKIARIIAIEEITNAHRAERTGR